MGAAHAKATEYCMKSEVTYASNNIQRLPEMECCSNVKENSRSKWMPAVVVYTDNPSP